MMDVSDLRRLLVYDGWANRLVASALTKSASPPAKSVRWFAHITGAEMLWLARLERRSPPVPVWPQLSAPDAAQHLDDIDRDWDDFFRRLDDRMLGAKCDYVNTKGEKHSDTVADILLHVVIHSAYHRGQIAADMRAAGLEPINTDFIHAVRQGHLVP